MIAGDQVRGHDRAEDFEHENAFSESDVRLLQTLASSMSVALENARLFDETQRLLKETEQRAAELAVINSIQEGMAAELDFQAIVDLVGDKLREVFHTGDIGIRWYDAKANLIHYLYDYEHGMRLHAPAGAPAPGGLWSTDCRNAAAAGPEQPVGDFRALGPACFPGTEQSQSSIYVPILGGDRVLGIINLWDYERENAYGEAEVRLLTTVAASMGVALENARLFDETQRLFKESEQRAAELAVINSIQQGLASKLELQGIIDLVGDKLRETFSADFTCIFLYDRAKNLISMPYVVDRGKRFSHPPMPPRGDQRTGAPDGRRPSSCEQGGARPGDGRDRFVQSLRGIYRRGRPAFTRR